MNDNFEPQDLTGVENSSLYIDTEGSHTVVIEKCENTTSKSGTPGWKFTYRDKDGRTIQDTCWLSEAAKWRLRDLGEAAGLDENELAGFIPPMIYGRTITIVTKKNPENPAYLNIESFFPATTRIDPSTLPPMPTKPATSDDVPF